jgi:hypothetical protein
VKYVWITILKKINAQECVTNVEIQYVRNVYKISLLGKRFIDVHFAKDNLSKYGLKIFQSLICLKFKVILIYVHLIKEKPFLCVLVKIVLFQLQYVIWLNVQKCTNKEVLTMCLYLS